MNRFLLLVLIGAITFVILLFAHNPDMFNDVWLYLIGLSGAIIKLFRIIWEKLKTFGKEVEKQTQPPKPQLPPVIQVHNPNDPVG